MIVAGAGWKDAENLQDIKGDNFDEHERREHERRP